jgi:hypothetical protein
MEHTQTNLFRNPRIIVSTILAILIVAGTFFASRATEQNNQEALALKDSSRAGIHEDADGDGLELWQEELWGTDPKNPDSDEDGTTDGDEVRIDRDPNKAGPKDRKTDVVLATTTRYYDEDPSLSTTDVIARDLYSGTVALEKSGGLTDENLDTLIGGLIEKARNRMEPITPPYSPNDIRVSTEEGPEVYRAYFNGIATLMLHTNTPTLSEEEATAMWTSTDLAERRALVTKQLAHEQDLLTGFLGLMSPADLAKSHLAIVNALGESREVLSLLANQTHFNPVEDLLLLQEFQTRGSVIAQNIETLFASPVLLTIFWNESDPMTQLSEQISL